MPSFVDTIVPCARECLKALNDPNSELIHIDTYGRDHDVTVEARLYLGAVLADPENAYGILLDPTANAINSVALAQFAFHIKEHNRQMPTTMRTRQIYKAAAQSAFFEGALDVHQSYGRMVSQTDVVHAMARPAFVGKPLDAAIPVVDQTLRELTARYANDKSEY
jgi:hypothetical protein